MVELTILGSYGPFAPAKGACSGYLLNVDGFRIMIDCGNGTISKLQQYTEYNELGILILTHLHPDHYCDIYCLRQALKYQIREGNRKEPLYVYLPEGPEEIVSEIKKWDDVFTLISLNEAQKIVNDFNLFQLKFFPVKHQIPTYGVQLVYQGETIFTYTSDTGWFPKLEMFCEGSKVLLAEASLREYEVERLGDCHMSAKQASILAQNSGASELILTHFFPEMNLHQVKREAEQHFDGKIYTATGGKKYLLDEGK